MSATTTAAVSTTTTSTTATKAVAIGRTAVRRVTMAGYEVSRELATMMTSAFGIVAALAWSDAVKGSFDRMGAFKNWPIVGPFVFAVMVTLAAYVASSLMSRFVKEQCTKLCTTNQTEKQA